MKIKMFIPIALVLCLAFSLCACGTTANTDATTTAPATTAATEATTTAPATTAPATTAAATEADDDATAASFTEKDALELVKNTYELSDDAYFYQPRGTYEVDGVNYYAIDMRKSLEHNTTYISTYFVTLDGSEILKGYIAGEVGYIGTEKPSIEVNEDNAVKVVEAAYDFEEGCFLTYRGTEEIDGTTYYVVDLRKSLEVNTTYLGSYFVNADGTEIINGYYEGETPVFAE